MRLLRTFSGGFPWYRIYRIGGMVFTGMMPMVGENWGGSAWYLMVMINSL